MHGHRIGYVRVSSLDQNPERQLEQVSVDRLFTDTASGKHTQRPQLGGHRHRAMEHGLPGTGVVHALQDAAVRKLQRLAGPFVELPRSQSAA